VNNLDLKNKVILIGKELIEEKGYLSSIDVLLKLGYLSDKDYENWRFGKVEYLERVCAVNLKKLSTINKTIKVLSQQWKLKSSWTAYNKYGKGEMIRLRFSKSGYKRIEEAYATHYLSIKNKARKHNNSE